LPDVLRKVLAARELHGVGVTTFEAILGISCLSNNTTYGILMAHDGSEGKRRARYALQVRYERKYSDSL